MTKRQLYIYRVRLFNQLEKVQQSEKKTIIRRIKTIERIINNG